MIGLGPFKPVTLQPGTFFFPPRNSSREYQCGSGVSAMVPRVGGRLRIVGLDIAIIGKERGTTKNSPLGLTLGFSGESSTEQLLLCLTLRVEEATLELFYCLFVPRSQRSSLLGGNMACPVIETEIRYPEKFKDDHGWDSTLCNDVRLFQRSLG